MISDIEVIIEKFKKGEMVILVDDEDRENEGDLIVSSQYLTCLLYTSPSPRDPKTSRMPSSA